MDLQYGIAVTNKYALFIDDEEDPLEILRQKEEEAKNQKKDGGDKKTKSKQSKKTAVVTESKVKAEPPPPKKEGMIITWLAFAMCVMHWDIRNISLLFAVQTAILVPCGMCTVY